MYIYTININIYIENVKTKSGGLLRWDIKSEKIDGGEEFEREKRREEGLCKGRTIILSNNSTLS